MSNTATKSPVDKMQQSIKITAKLYECRDSAKFIFKDNFQESLQPFLDIVHQVMKANNQNPLEALLTISKTNTYLNNGMAQLLFMTAVVEIMEPSDK
jgi:hypothetical protein